MLHKGLRGKPRGLTKKGDIMNRIKRVLVAVTLILALIVPTSVFAAEDADSPVGGDGIVVASQTSKDYNGKKPSFYVYIIKAGEPVQKEVVTVEGIDAGTYDYEVKGAPGQKFTYTINKASGNSVTTTSSKSYSYKKLKKRSYSFSLNAKAAKNGSTVTYKSSSKYVTVSKSGKVTVKKKAKKGTYKVAVTVTNKNYKTVTKYITVRVK